MDAVSFLLNVGAEVRGAWALQSVCVRGGIQQKSTTWNHVLITHIFLCDENCL